jgi:hypothetical protein
MFWGQPDTLKHLLVKAIVEPVGSDLLNRMIGVKVGEVLKVLVNQVENGVGRSSLRALPMRT